MPTTTGINWRRGLFRVWLTGSGCWIAVVGWSAYQSVISPWYIAKQENACAESLHVSVQRHNLADCYPNGVINFDDIAVDWRNIGVRYSALAIGGPLSLFGVYWIGVWISHGFMSQRKSRNRLATDSDDARRSN